MLNKESLRTEHSILYERKECHPVSGALNLHQVITNSGLQNSLAGVYCLLKIIHTTMTTAQPEKRFSTIKKAFLRNTISEERLSAPATLSAGNNLLE